jgi:putative Holliday junction resolvase
MHNLNSASSQTVLGFDYGTKKIGIAVGQTITRTSRGLTQVTVKEGEPDWNEIDSIVADYKPFALIIGHPLNSDGASQPITLAAENFAKALQKHYDLPIYTVDERLSTVEARRELFSAGGYKALSKKNIDMQSAQIILQEWLNRRGDNG